MIRPWLPRDHLGREGADGVGGAVEIVVDHVAPIVVLHLHQRLPALDGGIGDDDVDLAVGAFDPVGRRAQGGDVANIGLIAIGAAPVGRDLADGLVELGLGVAGIGVRGGADGPAMSIATTSAPLAAISTAIARPMPRAAPVTTATLPASIDPRPGRTGPALLSGGGSGMGWPSSVFGAVSVRAPGAGEAVCAAAVPARARPAVATLPPRTRLRRTGSGCARSAGRGSRSCVMVPSSAPLGGCLRQDRPAITAERRVGSSRPRGSRWRERGPAVVQWREPGPWDWALSRHGDCRGDRLPYAGSSIVVPSRGGAGGGELDGAYRGRRDAAWG